MLPIAGAVVNQQFFAFFDVPPCDINLMPHFALVHECCLDVGVFAVVGKPCLIAAVFGV